MIENEYIRSLISVLPTKPGIYQYFDYKGTIIYIGKAKNLKKRVSSYFSKNFDGTRVGLLIKQIADIQHLSVDSENDALLLENNLIKKYQPKYNVRLKDDKSYPWICISNEPFPRVFYTRNVQSDGSKNYGPYTSGFMVRTVLDTIRQLFKPRICKLSLTQSNIEKRKFKVCLEHHIGNCNAPCIGLQNETDYTEKIEQIHKILKGNISAVLNYLKETMLKYAEVFEFEKAQSVKDQISLLEGFQSKSTIVSSYINNVDVFSIVDDKNRAYINFLKVMNGGIIQAHTVELTKRLDETADEMLSFAITDIRTRFNSNATELILPFHLEFNLGKVKVTVPKTGDKKKLLELSERNARYFMQERRLQFAKLNPQKHTERILNTLKDDLRLEVLPTHIECFDNSNIQGAYPVAACVVFRNAKPYKKDYRHFNVNTVEGSDDFATMEEIVYRRYKRLLDEQKELPQLVIVDGGKGQLNAALKSLERLGLDKNVSIIGIAKRLEEIYFPHDPIPLYLDKNSESLRTIQQLRDEAHRFGITFHRKKRSVGFLKSELTDIVGVGERTAEVLLTSFKSVSKIKAASLEELSGVIGKAKAEIIVRYFEAKL